MSLDLYDRWLYALALIMMRLGGYQLVTSPFQGDQSFFLDFFQRPLPHIWLLRNEGREYFLLRLQVVEQSGPTAFSRDLRQVADHLPLLRKRLHARKLTMTCVYITTGQVAKAAAERLEGVSLHDDRRSELKVQFLTLESMPVDGMDQVGPLLPPQLERETVWAQLTQLVQHYSSDQLREEINQEQKKQEEAFHQVFSYGKPILTILFLTFNIIMFIILEWIGSSTDPQTLIRFGAKWNASIMEGELWRLFTPMFLHIGIWHLLFNSMALYFLGGAVERIFGSGRFLFIYLMAGLAGTVASFAFTPNLAAGASGAIFGCFGALLYFGLRRPNLFFRTMGMDVIIILSFNLAIGFIIPMVDNFGHLGGLIGGFLTSAAVNLPQEKRIKERLAGSVALGLALLLLFAYGQSRPLDTPLYHFVQSQLDLQEGRLDEARQHIQLAMEKGMDSWEAYLQLGMIHNLMGRYEEAEKALKQALDKGGDQAELYFHLSYAQLKQGNYDQGRKNLQETIARNPGMKEAYYNLALVYAEEKEYQFALEVLERAFQRGLKDEKLEELHNKILEQMGRSSSSERP